MEISAGAQALVAVIAEPSVETGPGVESPPNVAPSQLAMALATAQMTIIKVAKIANAMILRRRKTAAFGRLGWRFVFLGEVIDLG